MEHRKTYVLAFKCVAYFHYFNFTKPALEQENDDQHGPNETIWDNNYAGTMLDRMGQYITIRDQKNLKGAKWNH